MEKAGASKEDLESFGRNRYYQAAIDGNLEDGTIIAGQIAGLVKDIKPVRVIIDEMMSEAEAIIAGLKNSYTDG
tara:strand:- start:280 stop:501 length:222 start_codon:yes stop_codon:yes gene_type:complete